MFNIRNKRNNFTPKFSLFTRKVEVKRESEKYIAAYMRWDRLMDRFDMNFYVALL